MVRVMTKHSHYKQFSIVSLLASLLLLISFQATAALQLSASVDQNPVMKGRSFILEISANENISASDWDNSGLLDNFIVGRTNQRSQRLITSNNGTNSSSHITTLTTQLVAKQSGTYTIPAFNIKGAITQPIKLTVVPPSNNVSTGLNNRNVELKVSVPQQPVFIGQQFIYTSKLYIAQNTDMQSGNLTAPVITNASIKQIGKDNNKSEVINGRRFQTITRQYAITINEAGNVDIQPSRFEGQISTRKRGYRASPAAPVIIQGKTLNLQVKETPANYQGEWLVSDFVQLSEEWQPKQDSYKQGEPITRTITLTVANVEKSALPELVPGWPQDAKVYPDKPQFNSFAQQGNYFAQQVLSYAVIPNKQGDLIIPEMKVPWFNSRTQKQEWATLPAQNLTINASETNVASPTPKTQQPVNAVPTQQQQEQPIWRWLTFIFAGLWLITCCAWFVLRNKAVKPAPPVSVNDIALDKVWPQLQAALKANDAMLSSQLIHLWFKLQWPDQREHQLDQLPLPAECKHACSDLFGAVYGKTDNQNTWDGSHLLSLLKIYKKSAFKSSCMNTAKLAPNLNP
jgi:hypothetical protein